VFESLHKFHVNGTRTKDLNVFWRRQGEPTDVPCCIFRIWSVNIVTSHELIR
jgi:hypothetical protein